jgi:anti-anti-sigma regulatory factor
MFQKVADISIFGLTGDLDRFEGQRLLQSLSRLIHRDSPKIVLDFCRVEHVNYKIMADLVSLAVASYTLEGQIKLANISSYHRNILRVAGLEEFFETYETLADAIMSFSDAYTSPAGPC